VIRVVHNGGLVAAPFLDLTGTVATGGERGLLSLAFPPTYGAHGRFFVSFVNADGHLVIARFHRSPDPLVADPGSRFDLLWSTGARVIAHPADAHYGGHLVFGADGFLYVSIGDGGEPNDASHHAQNTAGLLGKFLRINVNVSDADQEGFDVPADNPFAAGGGAPEIWSIGWRNPWRFSVDDPARGGTGALVIADVGEEQIEEFNYEPAGRGGRNYGWRNREGAHDHEMSLPPAYEPYTDPTFEYDHGRGKSITGGFVYRGSNIPSMVGRYVFGDFVRGRVWSVALTIDPATGEASASDLREHTSEVNAGAEIKLISSFGVDAHGELYVVNWGEGTIVALRPTPAVTAAPIIQVDAPIVGSRVRQPFAFTGWALDATAATPGIATLHVWAFPQSGAAPQFLGVAAYGASRPDVAASYGAQFESTGFGLTVKGLAPGDWGIVVYGWVEATQSFSAVRVVYVTIDPAGMMAIDAPANYDTVDSRFIIGGWAIDPAAVSGTGIATIHIWAISADGSSNPVFLGVPNFGNRPDVVAAFGSQFQNAGFGLQVTDLASGSWYIVVYGLSSVSGLFDIVGMAYVTVR
jgi:Glucose / Sorbosone dehydrogenase